MSKCICGGNEVHFPETADRNEQWACDCCGSNREVFNCKCGGKTTLIVGRLKTKWSCDKCARQSGFDFKEIDNN